MLTEKLLGVTIRIDDKHAGVGNQRLEMMTSLPRSLVVLVKKSSSGLYCSVYSSICFFSASGSSSP